MIVYYMRGKHGHSCAGATHMTRSLLKEQFSFCSVHTLKSQTTPTGYVENIVTVFVVSSLFLQKGFSTTRHHDYRMNEKH